MRGHSILFGHALWTDTAVRPPVATPRPAPAGGDAPPFASPVPGERRRRRLAAAVIEIVRKMIADPTTMDIVLAGSAPYPPIDRSAAPTRLVVRDPDAVARVLLPPSGDAFAEAYLRGDLDIEGDVMAALIAAQRLDPRRLAPGDLRRLVRWTLELRRGAADAAPVRRVSRMRGARHSRARDMAAIRFHYDVGNAFYGLWLDARLTYSCAYFPDGATAATAAVLLDGAQEAKLDLIARKLRLGPDVRLLDIGSGWGSLIGYAAERYGTTAHGVTLSQRQADESNARAAAAGLAGRAVAEVRDYRDLEPLGRFDAVASVGMFEHVGRANLPAYFRAAYDALEPGGLFLNHGIAAAATGAATARGRRPRLGASHFLQRYVFPDGELVAMEDAVAVARRAGFEVIDVQSLRAHYALTLAAWVDRLEANWTAAVAAAGEEVARTWRLYMSAARLGFERGELDVCQILLARPEGDRPASLPRRPWW
jgi:cyclopropane-fatty-acyl-phospholipid synthase